jgi:hypothetical protein
MQYGDKDMFYGVKIIIPTTFVILPLLKLSTCYIDHHRIELDGTTTVYSVYLRKKHINIVIWIANLSNVKDRHNICISIKCRKFSPNLNNIFTILTKY